jgi:hypothetical protein
MKKIFIPLMLALIIGFASCNKANEEQKAKDTQNKAFVDKFIQAMVKGDVTTMGPMLTDDFKFFGPWRGDSSTKEKFLADWKKMWDTGFGSMSYKRSVALVENSEKDQQPPYTWVLEWGDVSMTDKTGLPPATFGINSCFEIKEGKIKTIYEFYNAADIMQQQGFKFVSPLDQKKDEKKGK